MSENRNLPSVPETAPPPAAPMSMNGALPPDYGYDPEPEPDAAAGLKRVLTAVMRRKWMVLALTVVGLAGGVVAARFVQLQYQAESTLWFERAGAQDRGQGPITSSELLQNDAWVELLRSFSVLDYVVIEQKLYLEHAPADADVMRSFALDSMFRPGAYQLRVNDNGTAELRTKDGNRLQTFRPGEPVGQQLGFVWTPPARALRQGRKVDFTVLQPREASRKLNSRLGTRLARGGNFLGISLQGPDREQVTQVVNAIADRYVDVAADLQALKRRELRDILERQLALAAENLNVSERALEEFSIATITLPTDTRGTPITPGVETTRRPALDNYFELRVERELLQRDREAIQRVLASGDRLSVDALSSIGSVRQSPELNQALMQLAERRANVRALQQQYTDEHTFVVRAKAAVDTLSTRDIPALARSVVASLDARVGVLNDMISSSSSELREIPSRSIEEARRKRSVAIDESLYNDLEQRYQSARLAAEMSVADVSVLDRAMVPTQPSSDPRITMLLMGLALGLGAGVALAILLDRVDPRVQYVEQITQGMRLSVLGAVPSLARGRKGLAAPEESAQVVEALRGLRLSLMHAYGTTRPIMFTVSSPGSGDGKTFMSSNLALSFADLGMRTLIIDGDTRRGQLHRLFGVERKPGLVDMLAGRDLHDVIRRTQYPLVDIVPGGTRRHDAPELLSSPRMGDLIAAAKQEYDVIIVDSPPLGAGVDPLVLGTLTGGMVMVMRAGRTDRALAEAKLQMLDRLPIRVLGTVVNGLDTVESYKYYSYLPGYEAIDEADEPKPLQPA